jgi:hypothetical protein
MTSFGIFQVPYLVGDTEQALTGGVAFVLGERERHSDQEIDRP